MTNNSISLNYISSKAYADEVEHVKLLLEYIKIDAKQQQLISSNAAKYATHIRTTKIDAIESFIHQYSLSTKEGIAIICLAESLLRIPDKKTATALIEDKLSGKNWEQHLGKSKSIFVNASSWSLLLTGKVLDLEDSDSLIAKTINRLGKPLILEGIKKAITFISNRFILGENLQEALKNGQDSINKGYNLSFDILGESSRTQEQADFYYNEYLKAIKTISTLDNKAGNIYEQLNLSVKLSALHPKVLLPKINSLKTKLLPRLKEIIRLCIECHISISFDAEESYRQDVYLTILEELIRDFQFKDFSGIGFVVQGYSKRSFYIIDWIANLAKETNKRIPVRLVKGAYWDSEIKYSQERGLKGYPVFTKKEHTDISYIACAQKLLSYNQLIFPQFATHNAVTAATIIEIGKNKDFEFQRLQGMGESLHNLLLKNGYKSRIYAPVGEYDNLLAYLMRRLLENSANSSFINLIGDETRLIEEIIINPIHKISSKKITFNPKIPLPANIYQGRINSEGLEIGIKADFNLLNSEIAKFNHNIYQGASIIDGEIITKQQYDKKLLNPANHQEVIGYLHNADNEHLKQALENADQEFKIWSNLPATKRAEIINNFADLLQKNCFELYALLIKEAGKTIDDAIAEVREAIDFARYYALKAVELSTPMELPSYTGEVSSLSWHPRGVFVCISPWNFPLAIFLGQVTAALASGNTAIAKPAENTTLIATYAINLMLEAGVPTKAISLLITEGRNLSKHILSDSKVKGVCFTGSTEVALIINRNLAARNAAIAPLIAETGGQNAMIVDSSALLEQAADAIVTSAFGSIGQRCSALRVLYIQEEIFESLIKLVIGAAEQLKIGSSNDFAIDLGPVIDITSRDQLLDHASTIIKKDGCSQIYVHKSQAEIENRAASFLAPRIIKVNNIKDIDKENFGPILHVISYQSDQLDKVMDEINSLGFGLTCGIQTRIEERIHYVASKIRAGNFYANRSIIGAQVATHPFGGEGNSGTGFKAGGPHYLMRFMTERIKTVNVTAIGGNIELLS
jgi:RHH-type proline utilization regulon transcriptional repressor/proline dehydrogenase/delta 1-pyrroline-5-carboxylate dehydrogenase